ncbi:MAG: hypothetical protein PUJ82_01080 [Spirochaetales bacterium]|nr:hypothetical protein [Spirochaetales bacterium]MDD7609502.1 hypothetical protein [Spirochaetales bacterium]MDY5913918.1 hypothetical protein [Treponema sp.]
MLRNENSIGKVQSVDTGTVVISVEKEDVLNSVQINQIIEISSTKTNEKIIGMIIKIMRKGIADGISDESTGIEIENLLKVNLVGTLYTKKGIKENVFKRTLNTVPSIDADCVLLQVIIPREKHR